MRYFCGLLVIFFAGGSSLPLNFICSAAIIHPRSKMQIPLSLQVAGSCICKWYKSVSTGAFILMSSSDMWAEELQQLAATVRSLGTDLAAQIQGVAARMDGLEDRLTAIENARLVEAGPDGEQPRREQGRRGLNARLMEDGPDDDEQPRREQRRRGWNARLWEDGPDGEQPRREQPRRQQGRRLGVEEEQGRRVA